MRGKEARLRRLEMATAPQTRIVVVQGTDAEHDDQIAAL